ncbi:MAG: primosomal protein DnaI [Bacilli bacterium]|nr:primosomal protein DnaI [Bacilli bacterium]
MQDLKQLLEDNKEIEKKLRNDFNESMQNEAFVNLVSHLHIPYEELTKYRGELETAGTEYNHCQNCKNLLSCKNLIKGYAYLPRESDGKLTFCYKECKFKQKLEKKQAYLKNIYVYDVPKDIREAKMKDIYKDDKNRYAVIKYLISYIKDYKQGKKGKGLYLHGNFGCGKTYLIAAMLNELAEEGVRSAIVFWPEYLRELKASFGGNFNETFNRVKKAPLLLIDDIGAENTTVWARDEILCPLVQYRMSEGLPTFFTSNLDLDTLEKHLSVTRDKVDEVKAKRIIERIKQLTVPEVMVSENLRK